MEAVFGFVIGILAVVFAFGFIIFIHELGHFLTARAVDIRCPQFAIGFGPSLFSFRWRGTNFAVRAFPFGGYVLMNGEEPGDRTEDPWAEAVAYYLGEVEFPATPAQLLEVLEKVPEEERAEAWREVYDQVAFARAEQFPTLQSVEGNFHDRSVGARILVISGGVIMNFISTILILWCLGPLVGLGSFFNDWSPYVSQVVAEAPAAKAGIAAGDLILEVDGVPVHTNLEAFHLIGRHAGTPVKLKLRTPEGEKELEMTPDLRVGFESFTVGPEGALTVASSKDHKDIVGKKVTSHKLEQLVEEVSSLKEEQTYTIILDGSLEPYSLKLPKEYNGARGQVGVYFGVNDIRFEKKLTGTVTAVKEGSVAAEAGVQVGDEILTIGELAVVSNSGLIFGSLVDEALASNHRVDEVTELEIVVLRQGEPEKLTVSKGPSTESLESLGITLRPLSTGDLVKAPFSMIGQMLTMPYFILKAWMSSQYTGSEIVSNLQGPVGIMQILFLLSDNGLAQFLYFVALLNAAIGAFNLLPFPALDGSRLVFLIIAGLRGKALDPEKEARIHLAGLMVLLGFVVIVTFG
ncbi:MAG: site-2 protease family protein, partial [Candidatus Eremiobacteraeota bacterium]|nr:site-2 protease family protein [Candidatus Eremiobacteraeota bacterium]